MTTKNWRTEFSHIFPIFHPVHWQALVSRD